MRSLVKRAIALIRRQYGFTGIAQPRPWLRRHPSVIAALALVPLSVGVVWWRPWQSPPVPAVCGLGLTAVGAPYVCVGLNLNSTPFRVDDKLADLRGKIADHNAKVPTGPFATIVLLEDLAPDPEVDSNAFSAVRHDVQGAITAVDRANTTAAAGGTKPAIKLLLASCGSAAGYASIAVDAITQARQGEHIVAVTGIGQSREATRAAVAQLSAASIAVVGSTITADNMNIDLSGKPIQRFFRVAPTNTDEVRSAASYIRTKGYHRILLIADQNTDDSYAQTLAAGFDRFGGVRPAFREAYLSPSRKLAVTTRDRDVTNQFSRIHSDICADRPDLIYFAGRGRDLASFLTAMSQAGACGLDRIDVLTGDDASNLVGKNIALSGNTKFQVAYTALAHPSQWNGTDQRINQTNYEQFARAFRQSGFAEPDLQDGHAIMNHDAALAAATAIRAAESSEDITAYLITTRCSHTLGAASGQIAFDRHGNPTDKAMPILRIGETGQVSMIGLAWPTGAPLDPKSTC
jgi:ABC-type branched-subunit amino acid transport system substrate-binding protein